MYDSPFGSPKCSVVGLLAPVVVPLSPARRRANRGASAAPPSSLAQRRKEAAHSRKPTEGKEKRNRKRGKSRDNLNGGTHQTLIRAPLGQFSFLVHSETKRNEVYFLCST